jgi:hypothetical protein
MQAAATATAVAAALRLPRTSRAYPGAGMRARANNTLPYRII